MKYSLKLKEDPIEIEGLDGVVKNYVLRELDGLQRDTYLDGIGSQMKFNAAGKTAGLKSYKDLQASLLALCVYDDEDKLVPLKDIQTWPAGLQGDLFEIANKMSRLDKGVKAEEGNG